MAKRKSASTVEAVAVSDEASLSAAPAMAEAPDVSALPVAWRVVKASQAYLFGQPLRLAAGKVLAVASYGAVAIQRLKDQGVELEPV